MVARKIHAAFGQIPDVVGVFGGVTVVGVVVETVVVDLADPAPGPAVMSLWVNR